jgi:predicted RecB family nuclease
MQRIDDRLIFSPSDLNHFLECEHLIQLERRRDPRALRAPRDAHADLLAEKGAEHERAWLARFRADGKAIVTIESEGRDRDWAVDAERSVAAMRGGADVIYQAVFADDEWHGVSDFLVRVERPSALGPWSYEAWDTKLARHTKPYFVLQLCFYTEQLERLQGVTPEGMVAVLGTGEHDRLLCRDFDTYYRSVRRRFVEAASDDRATYPYPVAFEALDVKRDGRLHRVPLHLASCRWPRSRGYRANTPSTRFRFFRSRSETSWLQST